MSWNRYRMSRDMWGNERHEHIHMGWTATFDMNGKRYSWKLGSRYKTQMDVECRVFEKYPTATNVSCRKHICEV